MLRVVVDHMSYYAVTQVSVFDRHHSKIAVQCRLVVSCYRFDKKWKQRLLTSLCTAQYSRLKLEYYLISTGKIGEGLSILFDSRSDFSLPKIKSECAFVLNEVDF